MGLPIELVGAWRRSGLIWKGSRVVDYFDVVWLQTPEWFVDIRLPIPDAEIPERSGMPDFFDKSFSFAGHTTYEAPQITWNHEIDSNQSSGLDSNPLQWENGVVFECGQATVDGETHPFIEEWLRMTDDDVTWKADAEGSRARIEVGGWAVEIHDDRAAGGTFSAKRYDRGSTGWELFGTVLS
jgi:hypothetical protein